MKILPALAALFLSASLCRAVTVVIDTTHAAGFFGGDPLALAAINAAAADISAALLPTLGGIGTDVFNGVNGSTTATFDWELSYDNPTTTAQVTLGTFSLAADEIRVFVGTRALTGSTLGVGGPGAFAFSAGIGGIPAEFPAAVGAAETASNAVMPRGGGPLMGSLSGTLGGTAYTLNIGVTLGTGTFDADTNNDTVLDDAATLSAYWHYDHTTPVAAGKNDLYSVAVHEILHAIGFGTATTWDLLKTGTTWNGAQVIGLLGTGVGALAGDAAHIAEGFMSPRLSDGVMQEVAMDPSITVGTRKGLTQLDVAFLRDIGYQAVPEPSTAALLLVAAGFFAGRRKVGARRA